LAGIDILNGGCYNQPDGQTHCGNWDFERFDRLNTRCKQSQTDAVFMFLTVVVLLATIALTYLRVKKSF